MKKSLSLLFATIVMAAAVAAATAPSKGQGLPGSGSEPCPMCPPGVCAIN